MIAGWLARLPLVAALPLLLSLAAGCGGEAAAPGTSDSVVADGAGGVGDDADTSGTDASVVGADTVAPGCAEGTPCDDGDPCTVGDTCDAAGACVGEAMACDDGLSCTIDRCGADGTCSHQRVAGFCLVEGDTPACVSHNAPDPANGCRICSAPGGGTATWTVLAEGAPCDDGDACTTDELCELGQCVAKGTLECHSDDPCVAATCDQALGCVRSDTTAACDDGDPCTVGDACSGGVCVAGSEALTCDDGDPCTVDSCQPGVGCVYDAEALCDDGDPCTHDTCLEGGNCQNTPFTGPCDDGNPCTVGEVCNMAGACQGGVDADCNDDNGCTVDSCHPVQGCLNLFVSGPCDDGASCTVDDHCVAGECFGAKTAACGLCPVTPTDHANKIVTLELSADGNTGSGLDVDGDPDTCAPPSSCSGGVDNALGVIAFLLNPSVAASVEQGAVKWVIDLKDLKFNGEPFPLHVYDSGLTPASADAGCDFQAEVCEYDVAQLSFDQDCVPYFTFDNARIVNGELVAGGTGSLISMVLPLDGGALLSLTIAWARVRASYTEVDGKITSMSAIISGAIPKAQLIAAIEGLDPASLPIDKAQAIALLDAIVANDIDLDGDGIKESVSLGMRVNTIGAIIAE